MKTRLPQTVCTLALLALLSALCVHANAEQTHTAYLCGYPDGTIRPMQAVTREELACILCRLAEQPLPAEAARAFADVARTRWSYPSVCTLTSSSLLPFGTDGWFCPEQAVTWRELCGVLDAIQASETGRACFPTLSYAWSTKPVIAANPAEAAAHPVTRAELARALNSLLGRQPDADDAQLQAAAWYTDNLDPTAWYYAALIEASAPHTFRAAPGGETWTAVG